MQFVLTSGVATVQEGHEGKSSPPPPFGRVTEIAKLGGELSVGD